MARLNSSLALVSALLAASGATATRVWTMCKATVPPQPSPEEMAADVEVGSAVECSIEYLFTDLCELDLATTIDEELTLAGSIYLGGMNRRPDSPDGSMEEAADCLPGKECYLICTTGSAVVALAQESADAPALVSSAQFFAAPSKEDGGAPPEKVSTACEPKFFSKQEMLDGAIFNVRKQFLIDQGMEETSDQLACPYKGTDSRYLKKVTSLSVSGSSGLRGAQPHKPSEENCTSLKALAGMPVQDILRTFPTLGFYVQDPAVRTMSKSGRVFKKFPIRRLAWDNGVLSMMSYSGQVMVVSAQTGAAKLTYATNGQGSRREDQLDGDRICVHNVPREKLMRKGSKEVVFQQQERIHKRRSGSGFGGGFTGGDFTFSSSLSTAHYNGYSSGSWALAP